MNRTHLEAFSEVCDTMLHIQRKFTVEDFRNHEALAEMPNSLLTRMLANWLNIQVKLGNIYLWNDNTYKSSVSKSYEVYESEHIKEKKRQIRRQLVRLHDYSRKQSIEE